jgi:hypothetical protein
MRYRHQFINYAGKWCDVPSINSRWLWFAKLVARDFSRVGTITGEARIIDANGRVRAQYKQGKKVKGGSVMMIPAQRLEELLHEYQTVNTTHDDKVLVSDPEAVLYAALTVRELRALIAAAQQVEALTKERDNERFTIKMLRDLQESIAWCGHASAFLETVDGGKHITCVKCERDRLKGQLERVKALRDQLFTENQWGDRGRVRKLTAALQEPTKP